ncbi:MAG: thioredoxin family protein [Planctomycetes bacterium]|nr:thioredoxin family protein [Planctomycetota bacterium]
MRIPISIFAAAPLSLAALIPPSNLSYQNPPAAESRAAGVEWGQNLAAALSVDNSRPPRPIFLFFTASWCVPCKELKETVCSTAEFARDFKDFRFVMIDIDSPEGKKLKNEWEVGPIPDIRFLSETGAEIGGFVGSQALASVNTSFARARASEAREKELRAAAAADNLNPRPLLELGEHLLLRPTKRFGIEVLKKVAEMDAANQSGCAAKANWEIVGALLHPIGRPSDDDLREATQRRVAFDKFKSLRDGAKNYRKSIECWLQWHAELKQWSDRREREKNNDLMLEVPANAPLRKTIAALAAEFNDKSPDDCIGDAYLIDGLLNYYSGDYDAGISKLGFFLENFKNHRWAGEGRRFIEICKRLKEKKAAGAESKPAR